MKRSFPLARHAQFAQVLHREREKTSHPFLFEKLFERFGGRNQSRVHYCRAKLLFRGSKIERNMQYISAAPLPPSSLVFIRNKTAHADAQVGSQPAFLRIKSFE